jgi:ubiquitin conjugation factor E4 B
MTENITKPFVSPELGQPFADGINFCLDALISDKSQNIKVQDPKKYGFDSQALLQDIIKIYCNMSVEAEEFSYFVVRDERSFRLENFDKILEIL